MKEIEKISADTVYTAGEFADRINEIIDAVNALIITHPKVEESAKLRRDFKELRDDS